LTDKKNGLTFRFILNEFQVTKLGLPIELNLEKQTLNDQKIQLFMGQDIPERLKEARKRLNLNQIQIASDLDIQQKSISDIENGKIINIPNAYIYYFFKKGISLEWIFDGSGAMLKEGQKQNTIERKELPLDNLFKDLDALQEKCEPLEKAGALKGHDALQPTNIDLYERIIESKDQNIHGLFAYIKSLENNLEYLKGLLHKALSSK
jgi:transcriptional regulator with XRE-family HTH domain